MEPGKRVPLAAADWANRDPLYGRDAVRMAQGGELAITSDLIQTPTVPTS